MDEEVAVFGEIRMESHRIEALLDETGLHVIAKRVDVGQIEKGFGGDRAVGADDPDAPDPLGNEQAAGAVAGARHVGRVKEAVRHLDQRDRLPLVGKAAAGAGLDFFSSYTARVVRNTALGTLRPFGKPGLKRWSHSMEQLARPVTQSADATLTVPKSANSATWERAMILNNDVDTVIGIPEPSQVTFACGVRFPLVWLKGCGVLGWKHPVDVRNSLSARLECKQTE